MNVCVDIFRFHFNIFLRRKQIIFWEFSQSILDTKLDFRLLCVLLLKKFLTNYWQFLQKQIYSHITITSFDMGCTIVWVCSSHMDGYHAMMNRLLWIRTIETSKLFRTSRFIIFSRLITLAVSSLGPFEANISWLKINLNHMQYQFYPLIQINK